MALLPPNSSGGGDGGTDVHNDLTGRNAVDCHPITAVTGLSNWLSSLTDVTTANGSLHYYYSWTSQAAQAIALPNDTMAVSVTVVRLSDGVVITPGLAVNHVNVGGVLQVASVLLTFSPPVSGDHIVQIVR